MQIHENDQARHVATLPPDELRRQFLVEDMFKPGEIRLRWWETDHTVLGAVVPLGAALELPSPAGLRAAYFHERRESGIINLGGPGSVTVDGTEHVLEKQDALYLGRGVKSVRFASRSAAQPARYWMLSYPAHTAYPVRHVSCQAAQGTHLGSKEGANERTIHKLIHPGAFPTCQIVMGFTQLAPGSIWNTMPPHTHLRRSEVYLYFDVPAGQVVFHFMGAPQATRHLVVQDSQAVLSPPWSIHCGAGTAAYSFVWGMGGENQEFADMDPAPAPELR